MSKSIKVLLALGLVGFMAACEAAPEPEPMPVAIMETDPVMSKY